MNHQRWTPLLNRNCLGLSAQCCSCDSAGFLQTQRVNHLDLWRPCFLGKVHSNTYHYSGLFTKHLLELRCWAEIAIFIIELLQSPRFPLQSPYVDMFIFNKSHMFSSSPIWPSSKPTLIWKKHCFPNEMMYIHGGRLYLQYVNLIGRHDHGDAPASQRWHPAITDCW